MLTPSIDTGFWNDFENVNYGGLEGSENVAIVNQIATSTTSLLLRVSSLLSFPIFLILSYLILSYKCLLNALYSPSVIYLNYSKLIYQDSIYIVERKLSISSLGSQRYLIALESSSITNYTLVLSIQRSFNVLYYIKILELDI